MRISKEEITGKHKLHTEAFIVMNIHVTVSKGKFSEFLEASDSNRMGLRRKP